MSKESPSPLVASQPQYVLVAQALMRDIARGHYPVGKLLPTELELCTQFQVSRHTIREAIRKLLERGMIVRQRGVGTRVKASQTHSSYVQSTTSISDLTQYVKDTRLVTTKGQEVIADEALSAKLKCAVGQRWICVNGFRYVGREKLPIALTEIYINPIYGEIQRFIGVTKVPVYTLIEEQFGERVVEVKQELRAVTLSAGDAKRLKAKVGSAGLLIVRHYMGAKDQVLEVAVNLHPADRFSYLMSLRLQL